MKMTSYRLTKTYYWVKGLDDKVAPFANICRNRPTNAPWMFTEYLIVFMSAKPDNSEGNLQYTALKLLVPIFTQGNCKQDESISTQSITLRLLVPRAY